MRNHRRLTGTKEGCAEGDCGACSVAIGEVVEGRLRLKTVNSCIAMVTQLHGKLLVSVEGLAEGKALHPVQDAMVEHHASQCGFCTPGFVMALFGLFHSTTQPADEAIHDALAGNLCRCTGYRPIVDAARAALKPGATDRFIAEEHAIIAALDAINTVPVTSITSEEGTSHAPRSLAELTALRARHPQARLLTGGTDLGLEVTKHGKRLPVTIAVGAVEELRRVDGTPEGLRIGAAVTYSELLPHLAAYGPDLTELIRRLGSTQIRNLGTMGGNIANASPIGDTPPVLLALDAMIEIAGPEGLRLLPVADFFTGYRKTALAQDELVAAIHLPALKAGETLLIDKISRRYDQDISTVCGAMMLKITDGTIAEARIAFGGMADRPKLAARTAEALKGQTLTMEAFSRASRMIKEDFTPISDFRASAHYRLRVAQNIILRQGLSLLGLSEAAE